MAIDHRETLLNGMEPELFVVGQSILDRFTSLETQQRMDLFPHLIRMMTYELLSSHNEVGAVERAAIAAADSAHHLAIHIDSLTRLANPHVHIDTDY